MPGQTLLVKITINPGVPDYPYVQVADQLRAAIMAGELGPQLPSILDLAQESGLAINTIRRAIRILADEGLVTAAAGRGTFVVKGPE